MSDQLSHLAHSTKVVIRRKGQEEVDLEEQQNAKKV